MSVQSVTVQDDGEIRVVLVGTQGPAGPSDHGALSGLADDDHTQYATAARAMTFTNKTLVSFTNDVDADDVHVQVRNDSGALLTAGTPVYVTGYNVGQELVTVDSADASDAGTMPAIAVLKEDLGNNASGPAIMVGRVQGLDLSAFAVGDRLWIAAGGGFTNTVPAAPNVVQAVGVVVRSHASQGVLEARAFAPTTKDEVGLGSVLNVEQVPASEKGAAGGVASLDADAVLPVAQLTQIPARPNPADRSLAQVWDSCYRDVGVNTDVTTLASGHTITKVPGTTGTTIAAVQWVPGGGLLINSSANNSDFDSQPIVLFDAEFVEPSLWVSFVHHSVASWSRGFYLKYVDANNWLRINTGYGATVWVNVAGTITSIATIDGSAGSFIRYGHDGQVPAHDLHAAIVGVHPNSAESGKAVLFSGMYGQSRGKIPLTNAQWAALEPPGKVGVSVPQETRYFGLQVGGTRV